MKKISVLGLLILGCLFLGLTSCSDGKDSHAKKFNQDNFDKMIGQYIPAEELTKSEQEQFGYSISISARVASSLESFIEDAKSYTFSGSVLTVGWLYEDDDTDEMSYSNYDEAPIAFGQTYKLKEEDSEPGDIIYTTRIKTTLTGTSLTYHLEVSFKGEKAKATISYELLSEDKLRVTKSISEVSNGFAQAVIDTNPELADEALAGLVVGSVSKMYQRVDKLPEEIAPRVR